MMLHSSTRFGLECQARFLFEKRTEPYIRYGEGASQKKIVPGAKSTRADQALLELTLVWCRRRLRTYAFGCQS